MKIVSKEWIMELKVSTHDFKVSTHEDSRQSKNEVLTHQIKESRQFKNEVSTHRIKESTHKDSEQIFKSKNKGVDT